MPDEKRIISAPVREVAAFILRAGDLGGSGHFAGPNRALEGTRGHQRLQKKRPAGYEAEVAVTWRAEEADFIFELRGRIDGVLIEGGAVLIEEIKTVERAWSGSADPLHVAQARLYAFMYTRDKGFEDCRVRVTYLDLGTEQTQEFTEVYTRRELEEFFNSVLEEYLKWVRADQAWRRQRDQSIAALAFPFGEYRPGQRALAVAVYRAIKAREKLFVEAPTGIGKTISVLFPAIKALGEGRVEKLFYLTAKTVGRTVAEETLGRLRTAGLKLRAVTLTAREKICFNNGQPCDLKTCPFALGYYDRIKGALRAALEQEAFTRPALEGIARQHQVCPFELSLDLSLWVDAIIGDYNYVFDPSASLKRFFSGERREYAILIDEAHNLVERGREMFSAELDRGELAALKKWMEPELPACAKALGKIVSKLTGLGRAEGFCERDGQRVSRVAPEKLGQALPAFLEQAGEWLAHDEPAEFRAALMEVYFRVAGFKRILELFDERYATLYHPAAGRVRLFCLDPSEQLAKALDDTGSAVFFSATLRPLEYYRECLGGKAEDGMLALDSPFPRENLRILVQDRIATQFRARENSFAAVAESIRALVEGRKGNYLVYFPSYEYLGQVLERFRGIYQAGTIQAQTIGMSEPQREEFIARFKTETDETMVAFAVMGGIFGEGIDLAGERLIGVAVVGVGLPRICLERELIREHCQEAKGAGFDYAYKFPGINRVLQAVGRVIRSDTDRGVALLIDQRFGQKQYRELLPGWWEPEPARASEAVALGAREFWERQGGEKSIRTVAEWRERADDAR